MATKIKNTVAQKSVKQQNVRDNISADLQKKKFFFAQWNVVLFLFLIWFIKNLSYIMNTVGATMQ